MAKKKKHEEHGAGERWAVPYADFLSLLLALFIALFAISTIDKKTEVRTEYEEMNGKIMFVKKEKEGRKTMKRLKNLSLNHVEKILYLRCEIKFG